MREPGEARVLTTPDERHAVLLVDDNAINQEVAASMLAELGCEVALAGNGRIAVELSGRSRYDVIFMDCQMPEMDGFDATKAIRAREASENAGRKTPIIALTANAVVGDRERCIAAGMDDYIPKPMSPEQLEEVLARWVPAAGGFPGPAPAGEPARAPRAEGPVDWTMVSDLVALTPPDFIAELMGLFFRDSATALTDLRIAWREDDLASWSQIAHKLRGSCATLGARAMMETCAEMENLDEASMMESGERLLEELEREFHVARDLLSEQARPQPAAAPKPAKG